MKPKRFAELIPMTLLAPWDEGAFDQLIFLKHEFSKETFGPSTEQRLLGILDHISKEVDEVKQSPSDVEEWTDLVILALDGLCRSIEMRGEPGFAPGTMYIEVLRRIQNKMLKNAKRKWPDWRTADPSKAIEHDRTHDKPADCPNAD